MSRFSLGLAALLFSANAGVCPSQDQPPRPLPPGVEIRARIQPQKATVGDPLSIDLDIRLPKGFRAKLPPLQKQVGEFAILEFHPGPQPAEEGQDRGRSGPQGEAGAEHEVYHARIVAAVYRPGKYDFPALPIAIVDAQGQETPASSPPLAVDIVSVLDGKDASLRSLKKQAEIEDPARWLYWLGLALLALTVLLSAWLAWRRHRPVRARPSLPGLDPFARAEADLRDLFGRGLIERGLVKQHYVALSEIVKGILEAGYSISTSEKTTSEIVAALRDSPAARPEVPRDETARVESFLESCDLVKFAKYTPSGAENEDAVQASLAILEACRKRASAAATASAPSAEVR